MTKLKTMGVIGAMLLGTSTLALAQTNSTQPGTMSPSLGQPQTGSHPPQATPQGAPSGQTGVGRTTGSTTMPGTAMPGPQTASRMNEQEARQRLEESGYSSISGLKPSVDGYSGRAMVAGKRVTVDVDGNGRITAK